MQTITPVDVHVENGWHDGRTRGSFVKKSTTIPNRGGRQAPRMRTCVISKTKTSKTKPQQVLPVRSRTPSPNREPW